MYEEKLCKFAIDLYNNLIIILKQYKKIRV